MALASLAGALLVFEGWLGRQAVAQERLRLLQPALFLRNNILLKSFYVHELVVVILIQNHVTIQLEILVNLWLIDHNVVVSELEVDLLLSVLRWAAVELLAALDCRVGRVEGLLLLLGGHDVVELLLHSGGTAQDGGGVLLDQLL